MEKLCEHTNDTSFLFDDENTKYKTCTKCSNGTVLPNESVDDGVIKFKINGLHPALTDSTDFDQRLLTSDDNMENFEDSPLLINVSNIFLNNF